MRCKIIPSCLMLILLSFTIHAQNQQITLLKLTDFELQSSAVVDEPGEKLSMPDYRSAIHWFPVNVPSTVLTGLVANKIYPGPLFRHEQYVDSGCLGSV